MLCAKYARQSAVGGTTAIEVAAGFAVHCGPETLGRSWQFFVSVDSLKFVPSQSKNERQWPFQEPKLEVPTIYNVYIRPM